MYSGDSRFQVVGTLFHVLDLLVDQLLIGRGGVGKSALAIQWVNCTLAVSKSRHSQDFLRSVSTGV